MITWAPLDMYLGTGKVDQMVGHYFYLNYFICRESLCPGMLNAYTSTHIKSEQIIQYLII